MSFSSPGITPSLSHMWGLQTDNNAEKAITINRWVVHLKCIHCEEQDNDFLSEPLALFLVMRYAVPVRDVVEHGPDLLELGFCDSEITQAAEHLGAVSKVHPVVHLDEQCSVLWREFLLLVLAIALGKSLVDRGNIESGQSLISGTAQHKCSKYRSP
jgi:hypothetical protein